MRSDRDLGLKKEDGKLLNLTGQRVQGNPNTSLSGHERNHLFMNEHGEKFAELSPLSGIDHGGDSRAFALFDFDRDGMLDIALVNANAPRFQIFKNQHRELPGAKPANLIALRLIGGNTSDQSGSGWSALDAIGARIDLQLGQLHLPRDYAAGRGLAAQNSATLLIGIGDNTTADEVAIRWPSGKRSELGTLKEGLLYTVYEDIDRAPDTNGIISEPYRLNLQPASSHRSIALPKPRFQPDLVAAKKSSPGLRVYTAMATWCAACKRELPQVQRLANMFANDEVEFYGIGVDVAEDPEMLNEYVHNLKPAYELLTQLDDQTRTEFKEYLETTLNSEALPCSVITTADGTIVRTMFAIPTVSELRAILEQVVAN